MWSATGMLRIELYVIQLIVAMYELHESLLLAEIAKGAWQGCWKHRQCAERNKMFLLHFSD
jgi:hypothetical protein